MTLLTLLLFTSLSWSQTVDVHGLSSDEDGSTTIEITKGKKGPTHTAGVKWEVVEGAVPVHGEPAAMNKEARGNWKTACNEWKKEFREDNKESKIISINCGTPECSGSVGQKTCHSTGTYKIKTKLDLE